MNVSRKSRTADFFSSLISFCLLCVASSCLLSRLKAAVFPGIDASYLLAAKTIFYKGTSNKKSHHEEAFLKYSENNTFSENPSNKTNSNAYSSTPQNPSENNQPCPDDIHQPGEKTYKIIESQFGASGFKYENFYIKNSAGINLNIEQELNSPPEVKINKTSNPQVLIYHTHTSEAYMSKDQGFFYESYYPRSTDSSRNVTRVGNAISESLKAHGIQAIHDTTYHDSPTYKGSYSRSLKTIKDNLSKYPSIKVTLDIHRDSLGSRENGKIKPTFTYKDKKAAQIMVVAGCDKDGSLGFLNWEKNFRLSLRLHRACENMFPGMTRPLFLGEVKYNLNLTPGSMLIEVGSDVNTLDEAIYSGSLLGTALALVLENLR